MDEIIIAIAIFVITVILFGRPGEVIVNAFTVDLERERQKLQHRVKSMKSFYRLRSNTPTYHLPELQEPLTHEKKRLEEIGERLERETQPSCWMLIKRYKLHRFHRKSNEDLRQLTEFMNSLLMQIGTGELIAIANQQRNGLVPPNGETDEPLGSPLHTSTPSKDAVAHCSESPRRHHSPGGSSDRGDDSQPLVELETPGNETTPTKFNKSADAREWMADFFFKHGNYIPDMDKMLLSFRTKTDIYDEMVKDSSRAHVSYSSFIKEWNALFKKYITLKEEKGQSTQDHTTITITTMDVSNVQLPQLVSLDESTGNLPRLNVHLTGALFQDRSDTQAQATVFRDINHVPHDSNFVIECLLDMLMHHKKQLSKTLVLQLYWHQRDIKKSIVLSSVALLVDQQIFEKIVVRFLPKTPIIKPVESTFSPIDEKLRRADIPYFDDLDGTIRVSSNARIKEIKKVLDSKEWIRPFIAKWLGEEDKHLWFSFAKIGGKTLMHYKPSLDAEWSPPKPITRLPSQYSSLPPSASGEICFKEPPDISTPPKWIRPRSESTVELKALKQDLRRKYSSKLSQAYYSKWESFMESLDTYTELPDPPNSWPLQDLKKQPQVSPVGESGPASII